MIHDFLGTGFVLNVTSDNKMFGGHHLRHDIAGEDYGVTVIAQMKS